MRLLRLQWCLNVLLLSLSISGCSLLYSSNNRPGNIITNEQILQLKENMTISEVTKLLGTPVLNQNHLMEESNLSEQLLTDSKTDVTKMEYVCLSQENQTQFTPKRISLLFEDAKLVKFNVW